MFKNTWLIFTFLIALALSYEPEEDDDYFEDEIGPSQYENLKMTDVLKMVVLPSAQEITNILTAEDNTTGEPENPQKLEFILHAIDYWRKHNVLDASEDVKGENITKVTFNLRDDFFDDDGSQYSRLSKKLRTPSLADIFGRARRDADIKRGSRPVPYIYVKNVYLDSSSLKKNSQRSK